MFASKKTIPARAADVLDLMIEFATLGEYGLEYPESADAISEQPTCRSRRTASTTGDCERRQTVQRAPRSIDRRNYRESIDYRAALRTPRIRVSFTD
jgi:hypothetical protein